MNDPGFMDGYTNDLPTPLGWQKGQTSLDMPVVCCPDCSSVQVKPYDNGKNDTLEWWECNLCRFRFRLPRGPHVKMWLRN